MIFSLCTCTMAMINLNNGPRAFATVTSKTMARCVCCLGSRCGGIRIGSYFLPGPMKVRGQCDARHMSNGCCAYCGAWSLDRALLFLSVFIWYAFAINVMCDKAA
jgi:hypothetical protein